MKYTPLKESKPVEYINALTPGAKAIWEKDRKPDCDLCELHKWAKTVCMFGNGPVPCKGMIVGEGPGTEEDRVGRPFVGRSGEYLDAVLYDLELDRKQFYITNATRCKPPRENKDDLLKIAVKTCAPYLEQEIAVVKPDVILAIGTYAYYHFMHRTGITGARGKEFYSEKYHATIVPTVHPSYVMQNPVYHDAFVADVNKFKSLILGETVPDVEVMEIRTLEDFRKMEEELNEHPDWMLTFDIESKGLIEYKEWSRMWCLSLTQDGKKSYFIPLEHPESPFLREYREDWKEKWAEYFSDPSAFLMDDTYMPILRGLMRIISSRKINNHNVKFDMRWIYHLAKRYGIEELLD